MSEQQYMAISRYGDLVLVLNTLEDWYKGINLKTHDDFICLERELRDLRPVKVVDVDAVVIEGESDFIEAYKLVMELASHGLQNPQFAWKEWAYKLLHKVWREQLAQLSTPAESATGDGMKSPTHETTEISSTSLREKKCDCTTNDLFHATWCEKGRPLRKPQSPKGVWIEGYSPESWREFLVELQINMAMGNLQNYRTYDVISNWLDDIDQLAPRMDEPPVGYAVVLHGGELFGIGFANHSIETSIQEKGWELTGSADFWSWKELLAIDANPVVVYNPTKEG